VEVVQEQHHGLSLGGTMQEAADGIEEAETGLRGVFEVWGRLQV
jgi:hypothetical protein